MDAGAVGPRGHGFIPEVTRHDLKREFRATCVLETDQVEAVTGITPAWPAAAGRAGQAIELFGRGFGGQVAQK